MGLERIEGKSSLARPADATSGGAGNPILHTPRRSERECQASTLVSGTNNSPGFAISFEAKLAALPPPSIDIAWQCDPHVSIVAQLRQVLQQSPIKVLRS